VGFGLYDPAEKEWLYELNTHKYFTPASNTKILTLYTAMQVLGDSIEAIRYIEQDSVMYFWGTGDPGFLYPDVPPSNNVFNFLKSYPGKLVLTVPNYTDTRYGNGWAWDDYRYGYQVEKSAFPIYGNRTWIENHEGEIDVIPNYYQSYFSMNTTLRAGQITRDESVNSFEYNLDHEEEEEDWQIPFITSPYELKQLLEDTLQRSIQLGYDFTAPAQYLSLRSSKSDSLFQHMMHVSDNFIAEQLLLLCGNALFDTLDTDRMIDSAQSLYFQDAPDPFLWYDGSGLSRYNLFTPRSLIWLLNKILEKKPFAYAQHIFPAGGVSGTIENWYGDSKPYVFAKTGTLRNKHCLTGFLITKQNRVLLFSFMHNNYPSGSRSIKKEMQHIFEHIRDTY
jgi:D-alanyl-D-alanine carboxypeptidase/D-alanyl-D-alanine-endopeptidase (penicillin-binding protein 4)